MADYSELKRLAEAATPGRVHDRLDSCGGGLKYECFGDDGSLVLKVDHKNDEWGFIGERGAEDEAFFLACTPAVVLGLIAENEKLAEDYDKAWRHDLNDKNNIEAMVGELAGAQAMLETAYSERDQLKAELEALREFNRHMVEMREADGFESWAEVLVKVDKLKAEVEALRSAMRGLLSLYEDDEGCRSLPQYIAGVAAMSKESGHE